MVMLSTSFQLLLIITTISVFILTSVLIVKKHMQIKYALLWFLLSIVLLIFAIFPHLVLEIANILHIYSDANAIFLIMITILYLLCFSFSLIFSRNSERIKLLTQEVAILELELRKIREKME